MNMPIKLAFLTTDNREQLGRYEVEEPFFGTAMSALLKGFAMFPDEIEVHVVSCAKRRMRAPVQLADNIFFHQPIVPRIGWGRSAFIGCGMAVRSILKKIRPDITHAQGTERDCGVSMMFAPKGPRLLTIHGHMARIAEISNARFASYYWLAKYLERIAVERADGVVALTRYTEGRVKDFAKSTWIVPNAVDEMFFDVKTASVCDYALCVAHVHPWKRQVELMEAMETMDADRRPNIVFAGAKSESEYGKLFEKMVNTREWCTHVGEVNREELKNLLSKATMVILPSIEDNCPMVVLEAMAAGVPVAAARIGGIPDLVEEEKTGLLFDPKETNQITATIARLNRDYVFSARCRQNSSNTALKRFYPKAIAERHLDIYRSLLQ
jgi:glycosyltransferase involved in cell wall biosynthesis